MAENESRLKVVTQKIEQENQRIAKLTAERDKLSKMDFRQEVKNRMKSIKYN